MAGRRIQQFLLLRLDDYVLLLDLLRREAAYGKDTRGVFRVHQFDKLEMFSAMPEDSGTTDGLLANGEAVQSLELPYRVVNMSIGDLGASAAKKYDIEAWFPSRWQVVQ